MPRPIFRWLLAFLMGAAVCAPLAIAHDLTGDVTVQGIARIGASDLDLILRVPLSALKQTTFPSREDGALDLAAIEPSLRGAVESAILADLEVFEDGRLLENPQVAAVRLSLASDRSLGSYDSAIAHLTAAAPLAEETVVQPADAVLDVQLRYAIASPTAEFSLRPGWIGLGQQVVTVLRFVPPTGVMRAFEFLGDPGVIPLLPTWWQAAWRFIVLGFEHILDGIDHLLFLFCLVIPFRRFRSLLWMITAFTLAHSVTLIASAFGYAPQAVWFPPMIETGIAASIVYMALENIVLSGYTRDEEAAHLARRRALVTFAFGLVHGFGFSFVLHETLQFAGDHLVSSLLAFNVGVELGQLLVLAILVPALALLFKFGLSERIGIILLSALAAHTGWHWMTERWAALNEMDVPWPGFDAAGISLVMRLLMLIAVLAGLIWRLNQTQSAQTESSMSAGEATSPPSSSATAMLSSSAEPRS